MQAPCAEKRKPNHKVRSSNDAIACLPFNGFLLNFRFYSCLPLLDFHPTSTTFLGEPEPEPNITIAVE
jgi:hypothetical protein